MYKNRQSASRAKVLCCDRVSDVGCMPAGRTRGLSRKVHDKMC